MVFFNYATMQMAAKIVYYGPGLCGKTTNLHHIYTKTSPQSRGEMVSLETETDRTLFFDLLPIDVGVIGGFKTRLQLYTVPGQVFYNTTRKLVLKGVDGIVFVVDSQLAMIEANQDSLRNLRENLAEIGLNLDDLPLVFQLNKRDLPNIGDPDTLLKPLDPERKFEYVEAVAASGVGVFETLKLISKLTLRTLRRRMTGEEPVKAAPRRLAEVATFRVKEEGGSAAARTVSHSPASAIASTPVTAPTFTSSAPAAAASTAAEPASQMVAATELEEPVEELTAAQELHEESLDDRAAAPPASEEAGEVEDLHAELPPTQYFPPPAPEPVPEAPPAPSGAAAAETAAVQAATPAVTPPEPEVTFSESEKAKATPEVKHVKVRSSIDIMAELEALRKRATQAPSKPRKETKPAAVTPTADETRTAIARTINLSVPSATAGRARSVRVTVSFEDGAEVLHRHEEVVDVEDASAGSISLDLKIDLD